jgi:hypothetical protein
MVLGQLKNWIRSVTGKIGILQKKLLVRTDSRLFLYFSTHSIKLPGLSNFLRLRISISLMQIRIQLFTSMRIRIQLPFKVMEICDNWSTDPPELHFEPPGLHCELLKFFIFDFNADPDPAFHSNADPDPVSKNNADPDPDPQPGNFQPKTTKWMLC